MAKRAVRGLALVLLLSTALVAQASSPPALPRPSNLQQLAGGEPAQVGAWIAGTQVQLRFRVAATGTALVPQVEWRSLTTGLSGQPTHIGSPVMASAGTVATVAITVNGLRNGATYVWQARVADGSGGTGPWAVFSPSRVPALRVDLTRPALPVITSPTNPRWGAWYHTRVERFSWQAQDDVSGIAGYSYSIDHRMTGQPSGLTPQQKVTVRNLADGRWVLHVWARDRAGNWSSPALYKFNLDTTPPVIGFVSTSAHVFNPYASSVTWRFSTGERSRVVVDIQRSGQRTPVLVKDLGRLEAGRHDFTWDGRAGKDIAPAGWYWLHITASDNQGNASNLAFGGIHVAPVLVKRIVISLSQQTIVAYEGIHEVWHSLATTGNVALTPTPAGHYAIFARYSPFQFVSPWPPGHPFWYASAWSSYAMEFIAGGYFIHDAPWRSVFGPPSQSGGSPGTNYGGTHGCVNVPVDTARFLWSWAPLGTTVDVIP